MKGIIVEVNERKAVLLNDKGEFKIIKNQNFKIGEQIIYKKPSARYYAACACIAAFFMVSMYSASTVPVSYVDIDINPSVRMEINLLDRVIGYTPLNEDGEKLIEGMSKGRVSVCVKELVSRSEQMGYINENHVDMEIDVLSKLSGFYGKMEKVVEEINHTDKLVNIELYKRDKTDYASAKNYGVSMGRYKAISEYSDLSGETYEASDEKMSKKMVFEIKKQIHEMKTNKKTIEMEAVEYEEKITKVPESVADDGEKPAKHEVKPKKENPETEELKENTEKDSENRGKLAEKDKKKNKNQKKENAYRVDDDDDDDDRDDRDDRDDDDDDRDD